MTEQKIDYAYNAAERIKVTLNDPHLANAHVTAQIATAEAVLALVEQLRIANLITLARGTVSLSEEMSYLSDEAADGLMKREAVPATPFSGPDEYFAFRDDIREGLGL